MRGKAGWSRSKLGGMDSLLKVAGGMGVEQWKIQIALEHARGDVQQAGAFIVEYAQLPDEKWKAMERDLSEQVMTVRCPADARPGDTVTVRTNGDQVVNVQVPAGVVPGGTFSVRVRQQPAPQAITPPAVGAAAQAAPPALPKAMLDSFPEWRCHIAMAQCGNDATVAFNFLDRHANKPDSWWHSFSGPAEGNPPPSASAGGPGGTGAASGGLAQFLGGQNLGSQAQAIETYGVDLETFKVRQQHGTEEEEERRLVTTLQTLPTLPTLPTPAPLRYCEPLEDMEEFQKVSAHAQEAVAEWSNRQLVIEDVQKVQNADLDVKFQKCLRKLKEQTTVTAYHGTPEENIASIVDSGFRIPKMDTHAGSHKDLWFGRGVYSSPTATHSERFTEGGSKMLVCEVAVGKQWSLSEPRPTLSAEEVQKEGYDSVHGTHEFMSDEEGSDSDGRDGSDGGDEQGGMLIEEYVVYDSDQIIPRYVITYRTMAAKSTDEVLASYELVRTASAENRASLASCRGRRIDPQQLVADIQPANEGDLDRKKTETALWDLSDLCRDNQTEVMTHLNWQLACTNVVRVLTKSITDEAMQWHCLRAITNSCIGNDAVQNYLLESAGPFAVRLLRAASPRIRQKAALVRSNQCPPFLACEKH